MRVFNFLFSVCLVLAISVFASANEIIDGEVIVDDYTANDIVDVDALVAALDQEIAQRQDPNDLIYVRFGSAQYYLKKTLMFEDCSTIKVVGNGMDHSKVLLHDEFYSVHITTNTTKRVAIVLKNCSNFEVEGLRLNGRANYVTHPTDPDGYAGIYGMLMFSCSDCELDRLRFVSMGGNTGKAKGGHLIISSTQDDQSLSLSLPDVIQGFASLNFNGKTIGTSSLNNKVIECEFLDKHSGGRFAAFGVRLMSPWKLDLADDFYDPAVNPSAYTVSGTKIEKCQFIGSAGIKDTNNEWTRLPGGFIDNAVEIGGPGCSSNIVGGSAATGCEFINCSQAPMECDKGSRKNKFLYNTVDGVHIDGNPEAGNVQNVIGRVAVAMRDAGLPEKHNGQNPQRIALENVFNRNTVKNVDGVGKKSGVALVMLSKKATFYKNTIDWNTIQVVHPDTSDIIIPAAVIANGSDRICVTELKFKENTPLPVATGSAPKLEFIRTVVNQDEVGVDPINPPDQRVIVDIEVKRIGDPSPPPPLN